MIEPPAEFEHEPHYTGKIEPEKVGNIELTKVYYRDWKTMDRVELQINREHLQIFRSYGFIEDC